MMTMAEVPDYLQDKRIKNLKKYFKIKKENSRSIKQNNTTTRDN